MDDPTIEEAVVLLLSSTTDGLNAIAPTLTAIINSSSPSLKPPLGEINELHRKIRPLEARVESYIDGYECAPPVRQSTIFEKFHRYPDGMKAGSQIDVFAPTEARNSKSIETFMWELSGSEIKAAARATTCLEMTGSLGRKPGNVERLIKAAERMRDR